MSNELQRTVVAVARYLDEDWTAGEFNPELPHVGELIGPNGARVTFNSWMMPGRLVVRGAVERQYAPYDAPKFKISVVADKTPDKIARDITRRILETGYWEVLAETLERKRQAEEVDAERQALQNALLKILGGQTFEYAPDNIKIGGVSDSEVWGDARVRGSEVKFELHVPVALAQRFASMVAAIRQEKVVKHP